MTTLLFGTLSAGMHEGCLAGWVKRSRGGWACERLLILAGFTYTSRNTDFTEKFFVRVDMTEEFPFLVIKMSPPYERRGRGI
jgi:hypothetical protein